jgi:hypothetical protein
LSETATPGSTAPLESTILPTIVPVVVRCADAAAGSDRKTADARTTRRRTRDAITSPFAADATFRT